MDDYIDKKSQPAVIGTFQGECADAEVTNENGLDITREVWENVFNSDIYKQSIELGWLIGYLGHPDDPNCMDFQNACIVMTEGHIEDDGKVYGTFNLIDTPVGRIVKTFIDSGVTFGISVRGAGDIIDNSVDPDTFIFRGFDLVTFPAYKEAIPEFTAIAAATDSESKKRYNTICAAIHQDLENVTSTQALEILQTQFPEQSETYNDLELRKAELLNEDIVDDLDIDSEKISSVVKLYALEKKKVDELENKLKYQENQSELSELYMTRKLRAIKRIVASQQSQISDVKEENAKSIRDLTSKNIILSSANIKLKDQLSTEKENNLQYNKKISANRKELQAKDSTIQNLRDELDKTVIKASKAESRASDLDGKVESLRQEIIASQNLLEEYQDAYASLYSQAVGVDVGSISITASTSVEDLQQKILGSSNIRTSSDELFEPQLVDIDDDDYDDNLITL